MKYLLFGTGDYYRRYQKWFDMEEVAALLDNAADKQGTRIDGKAVLAPEDGVRLDYDRIVILSFYVREMKRQLIDLGVCESKICHFYQLHDIIDREKRKRPLQYYGNARQIAGLKDLKKVLLLSQDLTLGGPSLALFHAARMLQRKGWQVVYASMIDGPLREMLLDAQIPVVVDENLQIAGMDECEWTWNFSMLICNTINFHVFLSKRKADIPVIWWLHDSAFFYGGVDQEVLQRIDRTGMQVVSVGPVPERAMHEKLPDLPIGRLVYGVADVPQKKNKQMCGSTNVVFTTIGYIERRKGQDLLMQAIAQLEDTERESVVFYLVGQDVSEMAQHIRQQSLAMPEVKMTGTVDRETINEILEQTDVLICPSREDPMPTVCAEAMMHAVPCIVSDATGTAEYLHDGTDGLIFQSEDVAELVEKIRWCMRHRTMLDVMGARARTVYETYFSMQAFEKSLAEAMDSCRN